MKSESFQGHPVVLLARDSDQVLIAPDHGARILRWTHEGRELITWPEDADWNQLLKVRGGNPVLFPFIARHFVDGVAGQWRDAAGTVREMPQHGFARDAVFEVLADEEDSALRMRLLDDEHSRRLYPFSFRFDVVVRLLTGSRLEVSFETTNTGTEALPYYPGHHFYLAIPHDQRAAWRLDLPSKSWAKQRPDGSIEHEPAANDQLDLGDPKLVDRYQLEPRATRVSLENVRTKSRLVFELSSAGSVPWYAVTTWAPSPEHDCYCVEPWLGLPNAIAHGEGLRWLAPNQTELARCILDGSNW